MGKGPWDSSLFGARTECYPSAPSPEPLPQEEEKLPQRNANPGTKVCSRPMPVPQAGALRCAGERPVSCPGGHLWSQYSSPGPELGAPPVSTQTPVSELQELQFSFGQPSGLTGGPGGLY